MPAGSREVVDNEYTLCERLLHVGPAAEEAIQCEVPVDSKGRLASGWQECRTPECIQAVIVHTRVFVWCESKLRVVLDVPSAVRLSGEGWLSEYISAFVVVADDGIRAGATFAGSCDEARTSVRNDQKEGSTALVPWRFIANAVERVCAAAGQYRWSRGRFDR